MTLFDPEPETPRRPAVPVVRVRMTVAYDGSGFHGFAPNAGVRTVGATLVSALEQVLGHAVELSCAGRTDKGVHAVGQVVSFEARAAGLDLAALERSVNGLCAPQVAVRDSTVVEGTFDARFSARSRLYRYLVLNQESPDPFLVSRAWHVPVPLDLPAMQLGCDPLIGEHDFSAFCRRPKTHGGDPVSLVRRVVDARWSSDSGLLLFEIEATAFCHQMVRSLVGTLVEMGRGKRRAGEMASILRSGERRYAGDLAPPHGLYLWSVRY